MRKLLSTEGFVVIDNIYTLEEINSILETISQADTSKPTFRRTNDLFAIRQFLKEVPAAYNLIFSRNN